MGYLPNWQLVSWLIVHGAVLGAFAKEEWLKTSTLFVEYSSMDFALDWQTAVALSIVGVSILTLLNSFAKSSRRAPKSGCGTCPNSSSNVNAKQLVTISKVDETRPSQKSHVQ